MDNKSVISSEGSQITSTTTPVIRNISNMEQFLPITDDSRRTELYVIELEKLLPYSEHKPVEYKGKYFEDKLKSIRCKGVMTPITVRPHPTQNNKYEILAGHTRVWAAKKVGFTEIPAYCCEGLGDDEAKFIFSETNLFQRSFNDMKPSERANTIVSFYDAIKLKSGFRSDLIEKSDGSTLPKVTNRSSSMDRLGESQGLSGDMIHRYIRISKLIEPLTNRVDNEGLKFGTAVVLSYLSVDEQAAVDEILTEGLKISLNQAKKIKKESELINKTKKDGSLTKHRILEIIKPEETKDKTKSINFSNSFLSKYFNKTASAEEIKQTIDKALELYFASQE